MAIRYLSRVIGLSLAVLLAMTTHAEAAPTTIGAVMTQITTSLSSFPALFTGAAYILGLLFTIQGVFLFKDHVDGGSGIMRAPVPISAGVKRFLAGGMLFSAPFMSSALKNSLLAGADPMIGFGGLHAAPTDGGMDQMIVEFIANLAAPASYLVEAFAWIAAILLAITGIVRLTHTADAGPRGPTGLGTLMTFLASAGLFSFGDMMGTFSNSLFGTATVSTYVNIDPTIIGADAVAQVAPVIESLMIFIMIVGFIAFLRGWLVLKAFADGSQQATLAQALTFLIGGALAINLGQLVNVLEATVGVNTITFS